MGDFHELLLEALDGVTLHGMRRHIEPLKRLLDVAHVLLGLLLVHRRHLLQVLLLRQLHGVAEHPGDQLFRAQHVGELVDEEILGCLHLHLLGHSCTSLGSCHAR